MPSKKMTRPQGKVQWNMFRERDLYNIQPFERRRGYKDFEDFTVMHGYSEAFQKQNVFDLSKQLRSMRVSMAVLRPPGSNDDYSFGFLTISDWDQYQQLFDPLDPIMITWTPPPEIKEASSSHRQSL